MKELNLMKMKLGLKLDPPSIQLKWLRNWTKI